MSAALDRLLHDVTAALTERCGVRPDAVSGDALARAVRAELAVGVTEAELRAPDRGLAARLEAAAAVGETYFHRHPEHFALIEEEVVPRFLAAGPRLDPPGPPAPRPFRAWSAGCSTGEEAYSVAAALLSLLPAQDVHVLGTDLVEGHVQHARAGEYGPWSCRGPSLMDALLRPLPGGRLAVPASLRARVSLAVHNLLAPPPVPPASQHLVLCRNVLVYLTPLATRVVVEHLAGSLAPGGVLIVGTVDLLDDVPPGLARFGPPSVQAYVRAAAPVLTDRRGKPASSTRLKRPVPRSAGAQRPAAAVAAPAVAAPADELEAVVAHIRALEALERGAVDEAARELEALHRRAPGYLPGVLERALLEARRGRADVADALMREVLRGCEGRADDEDLDAPEPMTVAYCRTSARAFLVRGAR